MAPSCRPVLSWESGAPRRDHGPRRIRATISGCSCIARDACRRHLQFALLRLGWRRKPCSAGSAFPMPTMGHPPRDHRGFIQPDDRRRLRPPHSRLRRPHRPPARPGLAGLDQRRLCGRVAGQAATVHPPRAFPSSARAGWSNWRLASGASIWRLTGRPVPASPAACGSRETPVHRPDRAAEGEEQRSALRVDGLQPANRGNLRRVTDYRHPERRNLPCTEKKSSEPTGIAFQRTPRRQAGARHSKWRPGRRGRQWMPNRRRDRLPAKLRRRHHGKEEAPLPALEAKGLPYSWRPDRRDDPRARDRPRPSAAWTKPRGSRRGRPARRAIPCPRPRLHRRCCAAHPQGPLPVFDGRQMFTRRTRPRLL